LTSEKTSEQGIFISLQI